MSQWPCPGPCAPPRQKAASRGLSQRSLEPCLSLLPDLGLRPEVVGGFAVLACVLRPFVALSVPWASIRAVKHWPGTLVGMDCSAPCPAPAAAEILQGDPLLLAPGWCPGENPKQFQDQACQPQSPLLLAPSLPSFVPESKEDQALILGQNLSGAKLSLIQTNTQVQYLYKSKFIGS